MSIFGYGVAHQSVQERLSDSDTGMNVAQEEMHYPNKTDEVRLRKSVEDKSSSPPSVPKPPRGIGDEHSRAKNKDSEDEGGAKPVVDDGGGKDAADNDDIFYELDVSEQRRHYLKALTDDDV